MRSGRAFAWVVAAAGLLAAFGLRAQGQDLVDLTLTSHKREYSADPRSANPFGPCAEQKFVLPGPGTIRVTWFIDPYPAVKGSIVGSPLFWGHPGPTMGSWAGVYSLGAKCLDQAKDPDPAVGGAPYLHVLLIRVDVRVEGLVARLWPPCYFTIGAVSGTQYAATQRLKIEFLGGTDAAFPPLTVTTQDGKTVTVPNAPGGPPPAPMDLSGTWRDGQATWTLKPLGNGRYSFVEKGTQGFNGRWPGLPDLSGTAEVKVERVVDGGQKGAWVNKVTATTDKTPDGKWSWKYELTLSADGGTATGGCRRNDGMYSAHKWVRAGAPPITTEPAPTPGPGSAVDISGTWTVGEGGEAWTFTPLGGGRYSAAEKQFGRVRTTATVNGNKMTMHIPTEDADLTLTYEATFAADGRSASVTVGYGTGRSATRKWVRVGGTPATTAPAPGPEPTPGPAAHTGMTLRAESRKAKAGETVTVPVWLLKGAGLVDLNFNLEYDASVVQPVGNVVKGNLLAGGDFEANTASPGVVQFGLVPRTGGIGAADGTLAQVAFKAVGQAGSRTALRLVPRKGSVAGGAAANPATVHGEIVIVGPGGVPPGDVTGDDKVDMADVLMALKISVGLLPHNPQADVDNDGQVTAADARLIREKVLGTKG